MYWLNVDKPNGKATLHCASSHREPCQPRDKRPEFGYWKRYETESAAKARAAMENMDFTTCRKCFG